MCGTDYVRWYSVCTCGKEYVCVVYNISVWHKIYPCVTEKVLVDNNMSEWYSVCLCREKYVCVVENMSL